MMNSINLPKVESRTLENGLSILAVRDQRLPLVTILFMLKSGAETDEEGRAGQADLSLEMLTLGTEKRSSHQIALDVDSLGARLGFYSGWDASFIEIEGLSDDLRSLLQIVSDLVLHPTFPKPEFDQLRNRRIATLIQDQDESEIVADIQFMQLAFGGTPYGHTRRGTVKSVKQISLEDLRRFHGHRCVADRSVLMIVGNIGVEDAFVTARDLFGPLRKSSDSRDLAPFSVPHRSHREVRIIHRPDLTQSQIRMGHPGISRTSPDHHCFQIANYILGGGGFSSRLMERVRSQKGYTYGISSSFKGRRFPGPFVISTFTPNETTFAVVQEVLDVLDGFLTQAASQKELVEAKNFYLGNYPFRFETPRRIAREILEIELYGLGLKSLTEYPQNISGVKRKDVQAVAQRYVFPDAFSVVIVGNSDSFRQKMEKVGPVETIDFQTLMGQS
jgi:zinc protease